MKTWPGPRHEILRLGVVALGAALLLTLRPIDEAEPSDVRLDRANHRSVEAAPR